MKSPKDNVALPIGKLRSLYWAAVHMREARDTSIHLMSLDPPTFEKFGHCILTGVVVTYARSFGENQGLSKIGPEFCRFSDTTMQSLHNMLLDARNTIYAHMNRKQASLRLSGAREKVEMEKIAIHIFGTGTTEWKVNRLSLPDNYLPRITALCNLQFDRLDAASSKMLHHFCRKKSYTARCYVLGEDFP